MKTILAVVVLAGVWYTASLRAENPVLVDQTEKYETGAAAASPSPAPSPAAPAAGPRMLTIG